ncbi:DUF6705 family protein [Lacinutrix salivirga]
MKNIKVILILTIATTMLSFTILKKEETFSNNLNFELNQNNPFIGTWKYQNGNEVFIINLFTNLENEIIGHYKKVIIDNNGNIISEIYNSNKELGSTNQNWPYTIFLGQFNGENSIGGVITDNTIINAPRSFYKGKLKMRIQDSNCSTCLVTAVWKVEKNQGFKSPNEPDFSMPTDIILTKIE